MSCATWRRASGRGRASRARTGDARRRGHLARNCVTSDTLGRGAPRARVARAGGARMRRCSGIDRGLAGGLGVLDVTDGTVVAARLARTPVVTIHRGRTTRREYDVPAMCHLLAEALRGVPHGGHGVEVALEAQGARPAQGVASSYRTGV